jgi:hypothetical protein
MNDEILKAIEDFEALSDDLFGEQPEVEERRDAFPLHERFTERRSQ